MKRRQRLRECKVHGIRLTESLARQQKHAAEERRDHQARHRETQHGVPARLGLHNAHERAVVIGGIREKIVGARKHGNRSILLFRWRNIRSTDLTPT